VDPRDHWTLSRRALLAVLAPWLAACQAAAADDWRTLVPVAPRTAPVNDSPSAGVTPTPTATGVAPSATPTGAATSTATRTPTSAPTSTPTPGPTWAWSSVADRLEVGYGPAASRPQYAALHLSSSYFRLVPSVDAAWATSLVLLPTFVAVENGSPVRHQGGPVAVDPPGIEGSDLVLIVRGSQGALHTVVTVRLSPPADGRIVAAVSATATGSVTVVPSRWETFKPIFLSSMHVGPDRWDAEKVFADCRLATVPADGWILDPAPRASLLGVRGGVSGWQREQQSGRTAPTIEVRLPAPLDVAGWVTPSSDANDDNVGLWASSDAVPGAWSYTVTAALAPTESCLAP
jgi:hypothetical protein